MFGKIERSGESHNFSWILDKVSFTPAIFHTLKITLHPGLRKKVEFPGKFSSKPRGFKVKILLLF
ncbi:hypothetical protein J7K43_08325 [Candidatus Calescamantes bacterium]|nr:hypothetical protein [Candidatus Calescamantes bacterium]